VKIAYAAIVATLLAAAAPASPRSPSPKASALAQLPPCVEAEATLVTRLDTATASPGDAFAFAIAHYVPAVGALPAIPKGAKGFGIIAYVQHARGGGVPGIMVVEPRYVKLADGARVPVMSDPALERSVVALGSSGNAPGLLGYVPFVGIGVSGFNALHHGKELVLPPGTIFKVVVGEGLASSACYVGR
jgi:hypothetical protein